MRRILRASTLCSGLVMACLNLCADSPPPILPPPDVSAVVDQVLLLLLTIIH